MNIPKIFLILSVLLCAIFGFGLLTSAAFNTISLYLILAFFLYFIWEKK